MYLSFLFVLQRAASIVRLSAQISQMAFVLLISIGPGRIADGRVVSVQVNILHRSFCQFSQFMLALRMVLMVGYRSRSRNQNKPFSGPVSTLLSSSAEFYSFSLSGRLRAVGLIALTMCHNSLYTINWQLRVWRGYGINRLINELYLFSCTILWRFFFFCDNAENFESKCLYILTIWG